MGTQVPNSQLLFTGHAWQVKPEAPQADVELPAWQVPAESQQPEHVSAHVAVGLGLHPRRKRLATTAQRTKKDMGGEISVTVREFGRKSVENSVELSGGLSTQGDRGDAARADNAA